LDDVDVILEPDPFSRARARVVGVDRLRAGIGTLGEKTLHAILKHYLEPDDSRHEIRIGAFHADIFGPEGIQEIQTAGFGKLRPKLDAFLPLAHVTLVYPVARTKWVMWIDPDTGEVTKRHKSPKHGRLTDIFRELVRIKPYLTDPRLSLHILLMDVEEYRCLNGWSHNRKRGSTRFDRIPSAVAGECRIHLPDGLELLIPDGLPELFRSHDFAEATHMPLRDAQRAVNVLLSTSHFHIVGKEGRCRLYSRTALQPCGCRDKDNLDVPG
jgi:hypothetical protein